ncbi:uncharacterized protein LOC131888834 isoform X2 [Tigriopus californicus]|uniref:uncharacterized protein LOC131888834 isoform X2 n=1 Tax=Tigriopus californicus TaxID=6832 RepID=UPI0027DA3575|nr:uncharacterized protein LOC131888834 isoform X2 [Tigriopus californicus]
MASLGNALVSKILGHSAAEKAFRPWWDNVEDFLVYGLVMLGLIVLPTAIINGTPLDCNFCQRDHCAGKLDTNRTEPHEDPGFNAWWVKKYCTFTSVDEFILYFPYILLIMALVIVLIERVFVRMFKAGLKLDTFYNLLVKESLECATPVGEVTAEGVTETIDDLENSKIALEVSHSFSRGSNYFLSYLLRTLCEFIVATGLLAWLVWRGFPSIQKEEFIYCDVHGFHYECAGHPQQFYIVTRSGNEATVVFSDPRTVKEFFLKIPHVSIIYTLEITPPTPTSAVVAFKMSEDKSQHISQVDGSGVELEPLNNFGISRKAHYYDLDPTKEYVIRFCIIVNGRAIARRSEVLKVQKTTDNDYKSPSPSPIQSGSDEATSSL